MILVVVLDVVVDVLVDVVGVGDCGDVENDDEGDGKL